MLGIAKVYKVGMGHRHGKTRLEKVRHSKWLGQTKNEKCSKPQTAYSFTPENRKKVCQFIKGVKLPDGFGFNFKHKVTDNDTNITGLKSHDCHIMMQRLLPYGLQQYLPDEVAKPIIELCSFFKQICSATLMEDDMLIAQSKRLLKAGLFAPGEAGSKFPNKDMKEEFPDWFGSQICQHHVDNDPSVSATSEVFALACGPTPTPIPVNSCVVNGVRFIVHNHDERRITQNSGICLHGGKDEEINEGRKVKHLILRNNMTQILTKGEAFKDDQYILATQVKQCFYLKDMAKRQPHWKVVEHVNHKKFSGGGVIVVEEDHDVIHFDNSSDLSLSTSLNDLDNATVHIDGQSTEADAPPNIIDLDEDDDIIDDEDDLPHDLADSDYEDPVNVDDDDGMSVDVARGHGGDGGGDDRKGTRKPNLGGRKAGRLHTRQETRNLGLKKITDDKGLVPIRFEWDDKKTLMPLGDHASHWSNYLKELTREMPLYYYSWQKVPAERKAAIMTKIGDGELNHSRVPVVINTFFVTHTVGGVFTLDVDRAIYIGGDVDVAGFRLQHPVGGSGGCGNDEMADDEDGGEDEEDGDS
nr:hypothetical protein [Tanacetum cinerariifolium]